MIDGVKIKPLKVHQDLPDLDQPGVKAGFLMEVVRADEEYLKKFGQSTFTVAYQGTIKGYHWHERQEDLWFVGSGRAGIVLYDNRPGSPTYRQTDVMYAGENDYKLIVIPVGVVHGYKVLSKDPVLLFYHTTEPYNPHDVDEKRIVWNDPSIGFDWNSLK